MCLHVASKVASSVARVIAQGTDKRVFPQMASHVDCKVASLSARVVAL